MGLNHNTPLETYKLKGIDVDGYCLHISAMSSIFLEVTPTMSPASRAERAISLPNPVEQPEINQTKGLLYAVILLFNSPCIALSSNL